MRDPGVGRRRQAKISGVALGVALACAHARAQVWEVDSALLPPTPLAGATQLGLAVVTGDFDGDGFRDVATTTLIPDPHGTVRIFHGGTRSLTAWADLEPVSVTGGYAVLAAGSFFGDGRDEIAIGEPLAP